MASRPRTLYLDLDRREHAIDGVLRRWTAVVDRHTSSPSTAVARVKLGRPLEEQEVEPVLEYLDELPVTVREAEMYWDEGTGRIVAASPHIKHLTLTLGPAHPDQLGLALPSLQHLHLRGGPYKMTTLDLPRLTTLLLDKVSFDNERQWLDILHACASLRVLGVSEPSPLRSPRGVFTSAHLPASLKHLYWDDWYSMWLGGYSFLHDLPASIRTLTVTEAGHYQAKAAVRATLSRYCSRRRIELVVLRTEVRGRRQPSLVQRAASL